MGKEKFLLVAITVGFTVAANADFEMTTKIVDRIEYEGLSNEFCSEVAATAYAAKQKKVDLYVITDAITDGLEKNQNIADVQKAAAKRVAIVLTARIYADKKMSFSDSKHLSVLECSWINQTIQGITSLNQQGGAQ